jgi:hypothetical protein
MPDPPHDSVPADTSGMVPPGDPRATVWNVIRGPWQFAAIYALARLGSAAQMANGPLAVTELAARSGADPALLERLLRCAASAGLLAETAPGWYALTSAGQVLVPAVPGSMHTAVLATGEPAAWQAMTGLDTTARTGEPAFTAQQGQGFYDYLAADPARAQIFGDFMTSRSADIADVIARLDFSGTEVVADIGGGHGTILAAILATDPHLRGVLFDRSNVLDGARSYLAAGPSSRIELSPGDYLTGPLPSADTYLLASILHNHDDRQARLILANIRATAGIGPRLLLADILLPDHPAPHIGCDLDVRMMALGTGRERTRAGYLTLLAETGFTPTEIIGTPYGLSIIDARAARTETTR